MTTTTDPTEQSFLLAVAADPHCDTVRLAYADWLTERGTKNSLARAKFIRLCYEHARLSTMPDGDVGGWCAKAFDRSWRDWFWTPGPPTNLPKHSSLFRVSSRRLYHNIIHYPCTVCVHDWRADAHSYRDADYARRTPNLTWWRSTAECFYWVRRGFVEQLDVHWHHLRDYGADLRKWHPIRKIKLLTAPILEGNPFVVPLLPELKAAVPGVEWDLSDVGEDTVVTRDRLTELLGGLSKGD